MNKRGARRVICTHCRWAGYRKPGECACYDEWALYCHCRWGYCPRCGRPVTTSDRERIPPIVTLASDYARETKP